MQKKQIMTGANESLSALISHLKSLELNSIVPDPGAMLEALEELDAMIELNDVKQMIMKQLKLLLMHSVNKQEVNKPQMTQMNKQEAPEKNAAGTGHMLNAIIYGGPGTGKTSIAIILAKIWNSMGLIKKHTESERKQTNSAQKQNGSSRKVSKGEVNAGAIDASLKRDMRNFISNETSLLIDLRKELVKLKKAKGVMQNVTTCKDLVDQLLCCNKDVKELTEEVFEHVSAIDTLEEEDDDFIVRDSEDEDDEEDENGAYKRENEAYKREQKRKRNTSGAMEGAQSQSQESQASESKEEKDDIIRIVSRVDFVGGYIGQTAMKTRALLEKSRGKVLFVDEAYSLYNGQDDHYGMEALTELNRWMSEHPDEIVILCGYKELMKTSILEVQPGFERRCMWFFELEGYTPSGLSLIFQSQVQRQHWAIDTSSLSRSFLQSFFKDNYASFANFGGDTNKLFFYCKLEYAEKNYNNNPHNSNHNSNRSKKDIALVPTIDRSILEKAFVLFLKHKAS